MEVYALIGDSGTGKSHRAMIVAYEYDIDTVIDDGLLIKGGCILAGRSAKRESTALLAVKRAIFLDAEHAREIRERLSQENPPKVLVLGTSLRMVNRITDTLSLPRPCKVIDIKDLASEKELELAKNYRDNFGMHVIPVPTIEVKRDFRGYLVDPLKYFLRKKNETRRKVGEKSIIRPKFSFIGKLSISEHAVSQISTRIALQNRGVTQVNKATVIMIEDGVKIRLELTALYGSFLPKVALDVQQDVEKRVEWMTGLIVYDTQIQIKSLETAMEKK